ncbi:Leukotriene-B4 omega-hydroxylase 3 [Trichoplax sp. H2]|nr:Leukotriene-B4 omega-hydroxylase 3 [Trichoplax sp. H2]|eukprot:RDD42229.1 Leukotriene-B4 omega-hydroxylase 3 [Trichoplax sp. H2]
MLVGAEIVLGLFLSYIFYRSLCAIIGHYRIVNILKKFPGPKSHWLLGNLHQLASPKEFLKSYHSFSLKFPRKFLLWYGPLTPVLSVSHPETIRAVIKAKTIKDGPAYQYLLPWLGRGILLENGTKWARNRRLVTPAFHFEIMQSYVEVMNQCVSIFIEKLNEHAVDNTRISVFDTVRLLSFDILLRSAFAINLDCQRSGRSHPFVKLTNENTQLVEGRLYEILKSLNLIYNLSSTGRKYADNCRCSNQIAQQLIEDRQKQFNNNEVDLSSTKFNFIDILLSARDNMGKSLTKREICDEVETFLFAGHDTTASAISWTLYCLAKHPQHQQKIYQEVYDICKRDSLTIADLSKLKHTTMCIKEAMRLHSTVPIVTRILEEDTEIDGITAPVGTMIEIAIYNLHHNPEIWPSPWEYDPDRYQAERCQNRDPYAYIPFSIGSRNCIGQVFALNEIKLVVAKTVYNYYLRIGEDYSPKHLQSLVLKAANSLWITVQKR